jgi:hypothetical protein
MPGRRAEAARAEAARAEAARAEAARAEAARAADPGGAATSCPQSLAIRGGHSDTGLVSSVVELVLVIALMPVAGYALIGGLRAARWIAEKRRRPPPPVPVDRLTANLRRLRAELDETETSAELTAKQSRVRSVRGAYLDTLAEACRRFGVSPLDDRATQADIYRTEAALAAHGLDVRGRVAGHRAG